MDVPNIVQLYKAGIISVTEARNMVANEDYDIRVIFEASRAPDYRNKMEVEVQLRDARTKLMQYPKYEETVSFHFLIAMENLYKRIYAD